VLTCTQALTGKGCLLSQSDTSCSSTIKLENMKHKIVHLFLALIALLSLTTIPSFRSFAQDPPQFGTPFAGVPDPRDVNMYQVHTRPYSAAGNFAGVTARLDAIKALGTNVIYLMPIYPHGTDSRSSASPYSIKDFQSVAAEYGTLADLQNLVAGAHTRGMAVILDFVVNGTSWDHPWITAHPDWYVQSGGVIQQLSSFPDVAALNFASTAMRAAVVAAMRYWIFAANVDGYRCDFANNPPIDFWTNTIANLRGIATHKLLMFAEGDRQANYQGGFDYDFGDDFYFDAIQPIAQSGASVSTIQTTTNTEYTLATGTQQMVRYTSNHDRETTTTAIQTFGGHAGVVANYLVCAYMRGVPFLTSGQEVDFNQLIPWPYQSVKIDWTLNPGAAADFTKVINFRNSSEAIRRGVMANFSDNNICAFTKTSQTTTEKIVVMVNLRNSAQNYVIPGALAGSYKDAYSGASVTLTSGATRAMTPFQYVILTNANVPVVPVTGVSVTPTTATVKAGLTIQLSATVAPANATNQNVTWTSGNTAVATVSTTGLVTGVAAGTATITAKTADGAHTATAAITVQAASSFTVNFFKPTNWGTAIRIYWWSALPAGVLADGTWPGVPMTATGGGWYAWTFTNVTSTNLIFNDGTNQTVNLSRSTNGWYLNGTWFDTNPGTPVSVTGVTVSPATATISAGSTSQLTASVTPANATVKTVSWGSSNTAVATVSSTGLVTAVAAGSSVVTATTTDGSFTAHSTISVPAPSGTTYYQIINRWQPNTYLFDAGAGTVKYGTTPTTTSYQWAKVDLGNGFVQLQNRATGNFMNVEGQTGNVQCGAIQASWFSAMWTIAATGDGWNYIQNRWLPNQWIHIENLTGSAQYANVQTGWFSAMWNFVNPVTVAETIPSPGNGTARNFVDGIGGRNIQIYPNPSRGEAFYLAMPGLPLGEQATVTIRDLGGKSLLSTQIAGSGQIRHHLPAGIYFVTIVSGRVITTKKLVIE
jgi:uncharacterized protein YjdB/glycosidase